MDTNTLKLRVHGIVVKGEGTGSPCTVLSDPARPRLCWHVIYVTDIVPILKYWGLALNRG